MSSTIGATLAGKAWAGPMDTWRTPALVPESAAGRWAVRAWISGPGKKEDHTRCWQKLVLHENNAIFRNWRLQPVEDGQAREKGFFFSKQSQASYLESAT